MTVKSNPKPKFELSSDKSLLIQGITGMLLLILWITNIFYNWGYFDDYSGPENFGYYFANYVLYIIGYGLIAIVVIFIYSVVTRIRQH